ncbi:patatin-like phospholipase family protein [Bordetella genomosp. 13]|uniref:patatin-like phospholipase family protein n=1 Tax=Bordetella genomosp. 13 TaxID=463040 RepID=UPI0011A4FF6D|nr:patatin-like phospholipase family protein [Bordetella genomosp. 13]
MPAMTPVYLAFQGGGARGIAHVGGLAAVESLGLPIKGVSGTSAGALVAALVAAGYSSCQMLNIAEKSHLLQRIAGGRYRNPTRLFTRRG